MKTLYFKVISKTETGYITPQKDRIYMIGVLGDEFTIFRGNEEDVIKSFIDYFVKYDPDRIIGFKQDYEDFPLLIERSKNYNLSLELGRDGSLIKTSGKYFRGIILRETKIDGRENIDLFAIAWRDFPRLPTKEIDELANALEISGFKRIPQFRLKSLNDLELENYLKSYIEIMKKIDEAIIPFEESISEITGVPLEQQIRMTVGELIDVIVKKEMKKRGIEKINIGGKARYEGGYVWLKAPGVYNDVVYLDFQSMYPSIIKVWNISPETVGVDNGEILEVDGVTYKVDRSTKGIIPKLIEDFLSRRLKIKEELKTKYSKKKDAEQKALKVMANAMYGYMGWSGATYYNRKAAELIAALARKYIKNVMDIIKEMGGTVIYVDTDGVQFTGVDYQQVMEKINSELPLNIELERIVEKAVYWSKKKYAHLSKGVVNAVGVEYIRRDYPPIIKEAQKKIIKALLSGDVDYARDIRLEYKRKLKNRDFDLEDVVIIEQLTKKPEEYEKPTKASIVAKMLEDKFNIEIHRGTYLYIVIVKGTGGPTQRARPIECVSINDVDITYYTKLYEDTINRTFEPFGVSPMKQWF